MHRRGPLYGYIAASIVFTIVLYGLLLSVRGDSIAQCESGNALRVAFNAREEPIDQALQLLIDTRQAGGLVNLGAPGNPSQARREIAELRILIEQTGIVALTDCDEAYPRPWPLP